MKAPVMKNMQLDIFLISKEKYMLGVLIRSILPKGF